LSRIIRERPGYARDLDDLDAEIARLAQVLRMAAECGFNALAAEIAHDLERKIVPWLDVVASAAETGADRQALRERLARIRRLIHMSPAGVTRGDP